jgi:hypothetical protein
VGGFPPLVGVGLEEEAVVGLEEEVVVVLLPECAVVGPAGRLPGCAVVVPVEPLPGRGEGVAVEYRRECGGVEGVKEAEPLGVSQVVGGEVGELESPHQVEKFLVQRRLPQTTKLSHPKRQKMANL